MDKRYYILFLIISLVAFTNRVAAQYSDIVCAGSVRIYKTTGNPGSTYQWAIDGGGSITNVYGDSIEVVWGNKAGTYTIQVVETSTFACKGVPVNAIVKVSAPPSIDLGNNISICEGKSVTLNAGYGFTFYQWNNGNNVQQIEVDKSGKYKIVATDADGCSVYDSVDVAVVSAPKVDIGHDTTLCPGELLRLEAGPNTGDLQYLWSDGSTNNYITVTTDYFPGISVKVTDAIGCYATDSIKLLPCDIGNYFKDIQNTITPNGDGKNDTWIVPLLDSYPNAQVQIYDKWGQILFQSNHGLPHGGWDGTYNGKPLPMDSYYYVIDLKVNGYVFSGIISIIR
jgi:gliding motility-associated-like protein